IRIFTVTGTDTALTVASIRLAASGRSRISALPASPLTTFLTGHPMLMSMIAAPRSSLSLAASAISAGLQPASCNETGSSTGAHAAFCRLWRVSRIIAGLAIISVTLRPDPYRRTNVRNGMSVTPVIGARTTGHAIRTGPMSIGFNAGGGGSAVTPGCLKIGQPHSGLRGGPQVASAQLDEWPRTGTIRSGDRRRRHGNPR